MPRRWSSSRASGVSRPFLAAVVLLAALTACAPDAGEPAPEDTQRVEVEGSLTRVTASADGRTYVLDVRDQGLLPLDLGGLAPPMAASGVLVEVPVSLDIPDDAAGRFAALDAFVLESGESLMVVDFLG